VTSPQNPAAPARVVGSTHAVLPDFDGPVCSVFAGSPAHHIADDLRAVPAAHAPLDGEVLTTRDPMAVLRHAGEVSPEAAHAVEQALHDAEIQAIDTAAPTPGAVEVLHACQAAGRPVVVSNNTADAIRSYLDTRHLTGHVADVVGRDPDDPRLMKPHPHLLATAVQRLDQAPDRCVLIGDAVTDIQATRAAGTRVIGYANRPHKPVTLADADAVVTDMHEIARAITSVTV